MSKHKQIKAIKMQKYNKQSEVNNWGLIKNKDGGHIILKLRRESYGCIRSVTI